MIEEIRQALDSHLATLPPGVPVAWPNTGYEPQSGQGYLRPTLLPVQPSQSELGTLGRNRHEGIYQIDVIYPARVGRGAVETKAKELVARFKRGTNIDYSGIRVRCDMSGIQTAISEPNWYILPVRIDYRAYLAN